MTPATLGHGLTAKGASVKEVALMQVLGRVVALWRYPVKSMAGESLDSADVSWHGVAGDRRWAFIRAGQVANGFPWLTIRQRPEMSLYRPVFTDPDRPDASPTVVHTPSGAEVDVQDPALAGELGDGVRVMKQNRGIFDVLPVSLMTTQTVDSLGELVGTVLDPVRFRPNLVVEAAGDAPYPEDRWVGSTIRVGDLEMRVDQRDQRCVLVNYDPFTTERNPAILRTIARDRDACLGVYGTITRPGRVTVGDPVLLRAGVSRAA
ncbi:MOSC domain-containing protein [Fodinicola feengrottensis]|uniref:MOSC domain-containing protein n=1 Tax=Fodinicola feengrottensis TaxID=435914 RepID=UPI0024416C6C|nr:MOSC N-terminal beta barrel domain-containing protein [Fodinicola feengrottensis]